MAGEEFGDVEAIFHEGACSSTTEWDGKYMMDNNYQYSKELLHYCLEREIPFLYASSAATYGGRTSDFIESREYEKPLNVYGYSKFLFDEYAVSYTHLASALTGMQFCGARRKKSANLASACRERSYILIFRGYFIDSAVVKLRKF